MIASQECLKSDCCCQVGRHQWPAWRVWCHLWARPTHGLDSGSQHASTQALFKAKESFEPNLINSHQQVSALSAIARSWAALCSVFAKSCDCFEPRSVFWSWRLPFATHTSRPRLFTCLQRNSTFLCQQPRFESSRSLSSVATYWLTS